MTHFTRTPKSPKGDLKGSRNDLVAETLKSPLGNLGVTHSHTHTTRAVSIFYEASSRTFKNARRLRKEMTEAEEMLWKRLSKNQLLNHRFRRQHPIGSFITDFYCHKARLVIEIDGKHHGKQDQALYDAHRTYELNLLGLKVLRFSNREVKHNIEKVLEEIKKELPQPPKGGLKAAETFKPLQGVCSIFSNQTS